MPMHSAPYHALQDELGCYLTFSMIQTASCTQHQDENPLWHDMASCVLQKDGLEWLANNAASGRWCVLGDEVSPAPPTNVCVRALPQGNAPGSTGMLIHGPEEQGRCSQTCVCLLR